jgi:hypothetical protein
MTYRIRGLDPQFFAVQLALDDAELARRRARREVAGEGYFPCRVTLEDAKPGEALLLTHYAHHAVEGPYRNAFAIYVRANATEAADYIDSLPPVLRGRPIALRGYTATGDLHRAALALADDVEAQLGTLLADPQVAYIDAHNAIHGCFAARIERHACEECFT